MTSQCHQLINIYQQQLINICQGNVIPLTIFLEPYHSVSIHYIFNQHPFNKYDLPIYTHIISINQPFIVILSIFTLSYTQHKYICIIYTLSLSCNTNILSNPLSINIHLTLLFHQDLYVSHINKDSFTAHINIYKQSLVPSTNIDQNYESRVLRYSSIIRHMHNRILQ